MWTAITQEDLRRAKAELTHSHFQMDAWHAEEREAPQKRQNSELQKLDTKIKNIEELERQIEAFVGEYGPKPDEVGQASPVPHEVEIIATWASTKFGARRVRAG